MADVYRDVRIVVKDGENVIINKKKQKVAPGEMETVILTEKMLGDIKGDKLSFEIQFDK